MDYSPFLTNHWSPQQPLSRKYARSPSVRGIPVHTAEPSRPAHPIHPPPVKTSSQKVVQIPVHFVGSESTRWASALKIQKVFRGFLVRKSVKKIKGVKFQVDEIEERLLKSEVVNLIERDEKERLKMNESLMALLFKLDSVRGIELGVRDLRKVVIRKAIALQEKIDAIVSVNSENASEINDVDEPSEATDQAIEIDSEKLGNGNSDNFYVLTEHSPTLYDSAENNSENLGNSTETENSDNIKIPTDHSDKLKDVNSADQIVECKFEQNAKAEDKTTEYQENCRAMEAGVDDELNVDDENGSDDEAEAKGKGKRDRELLEKMMEENAKMIKMMTQLTEKNEQQTQMLNALTRRVELLEKAFVCDMITRKKKKNAHSA